MSLRVGAVAYHPASLGSGRPLPRGSLPAARPSTPSCSTIIASCCAEVPSAVEALPVGVSPEAFTDWQLSAYLDVRNAYNRKNPEATMYNFDYTQSKPVAGLPFLPILGLRGEL